MPQTAGQLRVAAAGDDTLAFAAAADEAGLIVRPYAGDGVRCTIAETEANDLLIAVAGRFRQAAAADQAPARSYGGVARGTRHSQPYDVSEIDKMTYDADSGGHAFPRARGRARPSAR